MKPLLLPLAACGLLAGVGCVHFQPIGPLAKQMGAPSSGATRPAPGVTVMPVRDAATMPLRPAAPPPTPPSVLVTPGDVTEANPGQATQRLMDEMDADRKAIDLMPRYSDGSGAKAGR